MEHGAMGDNRLCHHEIGPGRERPIRHADTLSGQDAANVARQHGLVGRRQRRCDTPGEMQHPAGAIAIEPPCIAASSPIIGISRSQARS